MKSATSWFIVLSSAVAFCSHPTLAQESLLALVSSSVFDLKVLPTTSNFTRQDISFIETKLLDILATHSFIDIEAVVQRTEFFEPPNDHAFTLISWSLLGTVLARDKNRDNRALLNQLIVDSFRSVYSQSQFLSFLRQSQRPNLRSIADIELIDLRDEDTFNESDSKLLSTLDIVLVSICAAILLGIIYMIVQFKLDNGFQNNARISRANAMVVPTSFPTSPSHKEIIINSSNNIGNSDETESLENGVGDHAPSSGNTSPSSADNTTNTEFNVSASTPDRHFNSRSATTILPDDGPTGDRPTTLEGTAAEESTTNNHFPGHFMKHESTTNWFAKFQEEKDSDYYSDSTGDVFGVDVATTASSKEDTSQKGTAISEWMKTIQVVSSSSSTKTSVVTSTVSSVSVESANVDVESLEQQSLDLTAMMATSVDDDDTMLMDNTMENLHDKKTKETAQQKIDVV